MQTNRRRIPFNLLYARMYGLHLSSFRLFSDIEMKHVVYMYKTLNEFLLRNKLLVGLNRGGGGVRAWSCPQAPLIAIGTS